MTLFAPDLYRSVAIGFGIGALVVGVATIDQWSDQISPPAQAAEASQAPQPSADFWSIDT